MPPGKAKRAEDAPAGASGGRDKKTDRNRVAKYTSLLAAALAVLVVLLPHRVQRLLPDSGAARTAASCVNPEPEIKKSGTLFHNATFWLGEGEVTDRLFVGSDGAVIDTCVRWAPFQTRILTLSAFSSPHAPK